MTEKQYPFVSIIIPAYFSQQTIAHCLETMLGQNYPNYEIIVIDSSPDNKVEQIVAPMIPKVAYFHHPTRLYPHAARNRGVDRAKGDLFIFTDPDIYAPQDWVKKMVRNYQELSGVIVGSLQCYGPSYLANGAHFSKFDKWLPGGEIRPIDISPTANMLCSRYDFEVVGRFDEGGMLGDTTISWAFTRLDVRLCFVPDAVVAHDHIGITWKSLLKERYARGCEFALLRTREFQWSRRRVWREFWLTVLPLRLIKQSWRVFTNARQADLTMNFLLVSPIIVSGISAWLLGELKYYSKKLSGVG